MFRRRERKSSFSQFREMVWPSIGWRRAGEYLWHRLHRLPGSPYSIAAGLAMDCSMSFTPLVGIHFFLAVFFAWLIRGNVIAAMVGTIIGNPWTFPVIWISTYQLGQLMLGYGLSLGDELDFTAMFTGLVQSMIEADGELFLEQVWPLWLPMFIGCIPVVIVTWIVVYSVFFRLTDSYQRRRQARRSLKMTQYGESETKADLVP